MFLLFLRGMIPVLIWFQISIFHSGTPKKNFPTLYTPLLPCIVDPPITYVPMTILCLFTTFIACSKFTLVLNDKKWTERMIWGNIKNQQRSVQKQRNLGKSRLIWNTFLDILQTGRSKQFQNITIIKMAVRPAFFNIFRKFLQIRLNWFITKFNLIVVSNNLVKTK